MRLLAWLDQHNGAVVAVAAVLNVLVALVVHAGDGARRGPVTRVGILTLPCRWLIALYDRVYRFLHSLDPSASTVPRGLHRGTPLSPLSVVNCSGVTTIAREDPRHSSSRTITPHSRAGFSPSSSTRFRGCGQAQVFVRAVPE